MATLVAEAELQLEALFTKRHAETLRWCTNLMGDSVLAEDAVQEAFIHISRRIARGDTELLRHERAALRRNVNWAARKLLAQTRAVRLREERAAVGLDEDNAWVKAETKELVQSLCSRLPQRYRYSLHLRYVEGHPDAVSAQVLGITVKAFRCRVDRALSLARQAALAN